jgi:putative ABC transport system substrate-binding protein
MAYAENLVDMYRRAAGYIDRILKGTPPGDIPVDRTTTFEFVVNQTEARQLGLAFSPDVAAQVTEWVL